MRRLLFLILCLGMIMALGRASAQEILDGAVAAVVNKDVVTFSQVRELIGSKQKEAHDTLKGQELVDKIKALRAAAINELIDRTLILQSAKAQGIVIPETTIDERIQSIIKQDFGGDRHSFLRSLDDDGYTLAKFRELQRDDLTMKKMRADAISKASTPVEAKQREEEWLRGLHQKAYIKIP